MELRVIEKLNEILGLLKGKAVPDGWMDIKQVAEYSSMSRSSIRRSCQDSRLKYSDKHGKFLFRKEDVRKWVENG